VPTTERDELEVRVEALEAKNEELASSLARLSPRGRRPSSERNWDAYAAVIASFVGLLALVVSGYTALLQRQQLQATVWPKLSLANSNILLKLYLSNEGLGPALIKAVRVTVDNKPMRTWDDVVRAFGYGERASIAFSSISGRVIPADKDLEIALPRNEESRPMFRELLDGRSHAFSITVCYCSVMKECYVERYGANSDSDEPGSEEDERKCPVKESEQFGN
jgi:hypothetical protein